MGAELLIQSIGFKAKDRFLLDEQWAMAAFGAARTAIETIDDARLAEINAEIENTVAELDGYKRDLLNDLGNLEVAALGSHRQAVRVEGGNGIILILSGGMSWGDSPSELFDSMSRLIEAAVFTDARWPETNDSPNQSTTE
jgi:hypothetical protein